MLLQNIFSGRILRSSSENYLSSSSIVGVKLLHPYVFLVYYYIFRLGIFLS